MTENPSGDAKRSERERRLRVLSDELGITGRRPAAARGRRTDFAALIANPEAAEADFRPFFAIDNGSSTPVAMPFALREHVSSPVAAEAQLPQFVRYANDFARWRRQSQYRARVAKGDAAPILVAEGDSWFHFPLMLKDVVLQLSKDHLIWTVASAGGEIGQMVHEQEGRRDREYLAELAQGDANAAALIFSGGGNDLIGFDHRKRSHILAIVRSYQSGQSAKWYLDTPEFKRRVTYVTASYRRLISDVALHFPDLPIIFHGYDYALPYPFGPDDRRKPHWCRKNEFLGEPFDMLGIVEPTLRRAIVREMMDTLNGLQRSLAGGNVSGGLFPNAYHVDLRGLLKPHQWADEIHPTNRGYAKVADRFREVLAIAIKRKRKKAKS